MPDSEGETPRRTGQPVEGAAAPAVPPARTAGDDDRAAGPKVAEAKGTEPKGTEPETPAPPPAGKGDQPGGEEEATPTDSSEEEELSRVEDQDRARQLRQERDAARRKQSNLTGETVIGGISVAGDLVFRQGFAADPESGVRVRTGPIPQADLDWLGKVYVEPSVYADARQRLDQQHILVLRGAAGWGKRATALRLLAGLCANGLRGLEPDVDIQQLASEGLQRQGGYLVDGLSNQGAAQLTTIQFDRLVEACGKRGAHLVFTAGSGVTLPREAVDRYVIDCVDPAGDSELLRWHTAILRQHLDVHLRGAKPDEQERGLLVDAQLKAEPVQEHLATRPPCRDLERLAKLLKVVVLDDLDLDEALQRFEGRAREIAAEWFAKPRDLAAHAFFLALAVYNEDKYQTVLDAAVDLESRLEVASRVEKPEPRLLFGAPRRERLEEFGARIQPDGVEETTVGPVRVERVSLANPSLPAAVLDVAWHEHDRVRAVLRDWLRDLGGREDVDLRSGAAAAAGLLATYDFRYIHDEILLSWALSNHEHERHSCASALGLPARSPESSPLVLRLLRRWGDSHNRSLLWSAAAAWGAEVGACFPDVALRSLRRIAGNSDPWLTPVVVDSLTNLFVAGTDQAGLVLDALDSWTNTHLRRGRHRRAVLAFLQIAFTLWGAPPDAEFAEDGERWPLLLVLTHGDVRRQRRLVQLWRRTLNLGASSGEWAMTALGTWVWAADTARGLCERVESMLVELAQAGPHDERMARRDQLTRYLRDWADDEREPSRAAARLLDALEEMSE